MWKTLHLRLLMMLLAFLIPLTDTSNIPLGLSRVCGCHVEIIAVKVTDCTVTVFDHLDNFLSELYSLSEAFKIRSVL